MLRMRKMSLVLAAAACAALVGPADAQDIAIFGNNTGLQAFLTGQGYTPVFVTDAQVATPGFLAPFETFVYTRSDFSFGGFLSAAASANVAAFATGNALAFNSDIFDELSAPTATTPNTQILLGNAFALATQGGGGFVGEFRGSVAAFTANTAGATPLGLLTGTSTDMGGGGGGSNGSINATAAGTAAGLFTGVTVPYNPGEVEFGATVTGADPAQVFATYDNGNAAILGRLAGGPAAVPEPGAVAMLVGMAAGGAGLLGRRRRSCRR